MNEERQHEMLNHLYKKNHKALVDKLKIHILDALIGLADASKRKVLFREEIVMIREGVEADRIMNAEVKTK